MNHARLSPPRVWVLGAVFAAIVSAFWMVRIVEPGTRFDLRLTDLFLYYLPSYQLLYGALLDGSLTLWNPYQICGTPALASLQAGFFYPLHVVYLLLPVEAGFVVSCILHLTLVAGSMFVLVRRLGFGVGAAVAAALFLAIRGRYPAMVFFPNMLEAAAWLPLGAIGVTRLARRGDLRSVVLVAVCAGLSLLAGYPQATVYTVYAWGALLVILLLLDRAGFGGWLRASTLLGLALALGLGLAAVQLLPAWELTAEGTRSPGGLTREEQFPAVWFSYRLRGILRTLQTPFPVLVFSVGWLGVVALVASFFEKRHRPLSIACLLVAVIVMLYAMGPATWVFDWIAQLPALGWFRYPRRSLFLLDFFVAIAFAGGVTWLIRKVAPEGAAPAVGRYASFVAFVPAALLVVEVFAAKPNDVSIRQALDSMSYYDAERSAVVYERIAASGERAWIRSPSIHPPMPKIASYRGVRSVGDYEPLNQRRQGEFFTYLAEGRLKPDREGHPYSGRLHHLTEPVYPNALARRGHLLDIASAHWVAIERKDLGMPEIERYIRGRGLREEPLGDPVLALFRNPHAVPRAYVVYDVRPAQPPLELMQTLADPTFDPLALSFVEPGEAGAAAAALPVAGPDAGHGRPARIVVDEASRVEVEATLDQPGMLVLADSVYPGWRATVAGEELEILATNHLFRGVLLPAGRHRVVFEYRPWTVPAGGATSVLSLLALAALWVIGRAADELPVSEPSDSIPVDVERNQAARDPS